MKETKDSKYESINKTLLAVGKAVFVNFYFEFKDLSISDEKLAKLLFDKNPKSTSERQGFRIPRARHIFKMNQQLDALRIIIKSDRVDPAIRQKARQILLQEERHVPNDKARVLDYADIQKMNGKPVFVTGKDQYPFKSWYLIDIHDSNITLYNTHGFLEPKPNDNAFIIWSLEPAEEQIEASK